MEDLHIGSLIEGEQHRDAIHMAVAPVVAEERLAPGQHVGFVGEVTVGVVKEPVGIVDPFLPSPVFKGERFWLFLYPNTITSLRHDWTHPAFAAPAQELLPARDASEKWLREFIERADCPSYSTVMAAALRVAEGEPGSDFDEDYLHFQDVDAHGEIPAEFWNHVSIVLGKPIKGPRARQFSCSC